MQAPAFSGPSVIGLHPVRVNVSSHSSDASEAHRVEIEVCQIDTIDLADFLNEVYDTERIEICEMEQVDLWPEIWIVVRNIMSFLD